MSEEATKEEKTLGFNPSTTAVILVEFQEQWTGKGLYNRLIKSQLEPRRVVENTRELVRVARDAGVHVVHAPLILDPQNKRGWLAHLTGARFFTKDTPKAQFTPGVYEQGDLVAKGRYAFDPFVGSDLEEVLREHGIKTGLFTGFATDQCPAKGLRTALSRGLDGYLVSDCTATFTALQQRRTERGFADRSVMSWEIISELETRQAIRPPSVTSE